MMFMLTDVKITDLKMFNHNFGNAPKCCHKCGASSKYLRFQANVKCPGTLVDELLGRECTICNTKSYEVWRNGNFKCLAVLQGKGEDQNE